MIYHDLFLSILAMDSYNSGYGAVIGDGDPDDESDPDVLGEKSDGADRIGHATVSYNLVDSGILSESREAGFYAIAYEFE